VPHRPRPIHDRCHPVHVTVRIARGLPSLRASGIFPSVRRALTASSNGSFRVVHFSIQSNHLHLLVEAEGTRALGRGMQGLGIRAAKAINHRLGRAGRVWAERYHCRALRTPREVRHALVYVLLNGRKHAVSGPGFDLCSSARWFCGWNGKLVDPPSGPPPVARARTWLLCAGWRRGGPIGNPLPQHDGPNSTRSRDGVGRGPPERIQTASPPGLRPAPFPRPPTTRAASDATPTRTRSRPSGTASPSPA
jgi:REP-associated tyrosine transposase